MANETTPAAAIVAKASYKDGHVTLNVQLRCNGYGDSARITGSTSLTSAQARELARSLIEIADKADGKVASKAAAEVRRQKWRDREIAAGRMRVITTREFLHGR